MHETPGASEHATSRGPSRRPLLKSSLLDRIAGQGQVSINHEDPARVTDKDSRSGGGAYPGGRKRALLRRCAAQCSSADCYVAQYTGCNSGQYSARPLLLCVTP